ncbi:class I SAM-dependent methyltransferase [Actinophytocola gossypii]|uniref:Class I SAM-dependent methyltransferase n=1 Tax=Actinophytocola gossypii TaxID=2812003 RepID=A0ABT2J758_9PSEU|nr:class I SAM-dependent methyltransferase [Actinophytocola gossypii]MCT2583692.1 class I SAM-dependent methyltransferase [Actinophytocola gossypii]
MTMTDDPLDPAAVLGSLRGTVLEIGPGAGRNLPHYAPGVHWVGVEPNARRRSRLRARADRLGRPVLVLPGVAERLALGDGRVDAVVGTFVLCSVGDLARAVDEVRRVLRPGGRYVFAEHVVAAEGSRSLRAQRAFGAVTRLFGARCRPDRDSLAAITRAAFEVTELRRWGRPGPLGVVQHIAGVARRPATTEGTLP